MGGLLDKPLKEKGIETGGTVLVYPVDPAPENLSIDLFTGKSMKTSIDTWEMFHCYV